MKQLSLILLASILAFSSCKKDEDEDPIVGETILIDEDITEDQIWITGNTYLIEGTIRIGNETGLNLTIQPGVTVKFKEDAQLDVAYWGNNYATVSANGTAALPIIFTSNSTSPSAGDWGGVYLFKGANNCEFSYCTFQYGGGEDYYGMIYIEEASASFENCNIKNSASSGMILRDEAFFSSFTRNNFINNGSYHISIYPYAVHTIGLNNTYSADFGILVSNDADIDKKGSYTWLKQAVPYFIEGTVRIGDIGTGVNLTIEAGTTLKFMESAQFDIAYWSDRYATFTAIGTVEEPIVFTSSNPSPVKGDWNGLFFYEGVSNSTISHCEIKYGGGNEYYGMLALVDCDSPLIINNTAFSYSKSHAITVDNDSSVDFSDNVTFSNIDGSNFEIR